MMHLDTLMTMLDRAAFVLYPYLDRNLRSRTATAPGQPLEVRHNPSLWEALAEALAVPEVTVLTADEDVRAAETNFLKSKPPVEPTSVVMPKPSTNRNRTGWMKLDRMRARVRTKRMSSSSVTMPTVRSSSARFTCSSVTGVVAAVTAVVVVC
jgi:Arginine deiminase